MTILFAIRDRAALDWIGPAARELGARGHRLVAWLARPGASGDDSAFDIRGLPGAAGDDHWRAVAGRVRTLRAFVRTLDRDWRDDLSARRAAKDAAPAGLASLVERSVLRYGPARRRLAAVLRALEHGVPVDEPIRLALARLSPAAVIVELGLEAQPDIIRASRVLGLPTAGLVTSPAAVALPLSEPAPDRVLVWNAGQAGLLTDRLAFDRGRVEAVGAVGLAGWTSMAPPGGAPVVLLAGSDLGKESRDEAALFETLAAGLRARRPNVRIRVRPHPHAWPAETALSDPRGDVAEAHIVVGHDTTLLLAAAAAGRAVLLLRHPQYGAVQAASARFRYVLEPEVTGLPMADHTEAVDVIDRWLAAAPAPASTEMREQVWRPDGRDAARAAADAIEALAAASPGPPEADGSVVARAVLGVPVAARRAKARQRRARKDLKRAARRSRERAAHRRRRALRDLMANPAPRAYVLGGDEAIDTIPEAREARERITAIARGRGPIIVGPWLSETGFELLYWIPFVRWARVYGSLRDERIVVVSRGGAGGWYRDICGDAGRYEDVFDYFDPDEFRARNEARIAGQDGQKHVDVTDFDRDIVERVSRRRNLARAEWLHPSLMYNLFRLFWMQQAPLSLVQAFTRHRRIDRPAPAAPVAAAMPARYVAAKFYANAGFPDSDENRAFVAAVVARLAERHDVVLLNTGTRFDDHAEFTPRARARVHVMPADISATTNLAWQTDVISRADAYVGTYGGFSYLAPLLGTDSLTFHSERAAFRLDHLEVAERVFSEVGAGRFVVARTADLPVVDRLFG